MKVVILQSNYLPWRGYFDLIHDADYFVFYDEVKFTRQDWRNRNRIYPKNGLAWLTVPVDGGANHKKISDVEIAGDRWQKSHLHSLHYGYRPARYFQQLEPLFKEWYLEHEWKRLVNLNHHTIRQICTLLGIRTNFVESKELDLTGERVTRLVSMAKQLNATEYISGPAAKGYLAGEEHLFQEHGIKLTYKDYSGYPAYEQLREPYEAAVSIVDLIANVSLDSIPELIWGWRKEALPPSILAEN